MRKVEREYLRGRGEVERLQGNYQGVIGEKVVFCYRLKMIKTINKDYRPIKNTLNNSKIKYNYKEHNSGNPPYTSTNKYTPANNSKIPVKKKTSNSAKLKILCKISSVILHKQLTVNNMHKNKEN